MWLKVWLTFSVKTFVDETPLQNHIWSRIYTEQLSSTPSPRWWRPVPMSPRSASRRRRPASRPPAGSPGAGPPGHTCAPPAGRWCCAAGRGSEPPPASCGRSGRNGGLWCRRARARPLSYGSKPGWSTWTERHGRLWRAAWGNHLNQNTSQCCDLWLKNRKELTEKLTYRPCSHSGHFVEKLRWCSKLSNLL